jgi:hypothetical protein
VIITKNIDEDKDFETTVTIENKLLKLEQRIKELEDKLDEKDRELREISINRAEFVQQLNMIYTMLKKVRFSVGSGELVKRALGLEQTPIPAEKDSAEIEMQKEIAKEDETESDIGKSSQESKEDVNLSVDVKTISKEPDSDNTVVVKKDDGEGDLKVLKGTTGHLDVISSLEPEKLEFLGKYSYRERMILMNRIDIYRLYTTVIILSSQIKYPRTLTDIEEKELRDFIKELSEFENLVLDLNVEEDLIWEKGKVCEKQAIQLFNRFFSI